MAFDARNFSVLAYANGFSLWLYRSHVDGLAAVSAENYFADALGMPKFGDLITVSAHDGARILCVTMAGHGKVITGPLS